MSALLALVWDVFQFLVQVGLIAVLIYFALTYLRGTRAAIILMGIVITTFVGWFLAQSLDLEVLEWILSKVPALLAFALVIIFQPELRRAFAEIGSNPQRLFREDLNVNEQIDAIVESAFYLGDRKIGALIVIERDIPMKALAESGVRVNAPVSRQLLSTLFFKDTPLHDGAVILKDGLIVAASCFITKLGDTDDLDGDLGTRHRAGIGITEETDAVSVIVSEETGAVSLAYKGRLAHGVEKQRLRRHLTNFIAKKRRLSSKRGAANPIQTGMQNLKSKVFEETDSLDSRGDA